MSHADRHYGSRHGAGAGRSGRKGLQSLCRQALRSERPPAIDRIPRDGLTMALSDLEVGEEEIEVARWLEESGRRRINKDWLANLTPPPAPDVRTQEPARRQYLRPSTLYLFALGATSYLLYFFADVEL